MKYRPAEKWIFISLFALVWLYLWLKAQFIPLAHDEIATFYYFIQPGRFLPFLSKWEANNHILNSAFSSLFCHWFGYDNVFIRLTNLLSFPIYGYYIYLFSCQIKNTYLRWIWIVALLLPHHFIEFFALSRGYGLSMAFLLGAAWHTLRALQTGLSRHYFLSCLMTFLALSANLAIMNTALIITAILIIHLILTFPKLNRKEKIYKSLSIGVICLLPVIFYTVYSFVMKDRGLLYYGTREGFWQLTVETLIFLVTGSHSVVIKIYALLLTLLSIIGTIILFSRKTNPPELFSPLPVFLVLLAANIIATILLEKIFGVNYPEDRVAMYFYPLFAGAVIFFMDHLPTQGHRVSKMIVILAVIPFLYFPYQFVTRMNLTYAFGYKADYMPERFYELVSDHHRPGEPPPTVGGYRLKMFTWSMWDYRHGGTQSAIYHTSYPGLEADFQIVNVEEYPRWLEYYDTLDHERVNDRYLLKRKHFLEKRRLFERDNISTGGETSLEYFRLYECGVDSLAGRSLYVTADMNIESPARPFEAWLVFHLMDKDRNELRYEFISLDWIRESWKGETSHFLNGMIIHDLPPESAILNVYLWNIRSRPYTLSSASVGYYELLKDY